MYNILPPIDTVLSKVHPLKQLEPGTADVGIFTCYILTQFTNALALNNVKLGKSNAPFKPVHPTKVEVYIDYT